MNRQLKILKKHYGSWSAVCAKLGISRRTLSRYQRGENVTQMARNWVNHLVFDISLGEVFRHDKEA